MPACLSSPQSAHARIGALDGLRGIAIGLVVLHHYADHLSAGSMLRQAAAFGWAGVDLFFVLSGYLIGRILLENRTAPRLLPVFYLRRALRILPLYYVTLGLLLWKLPAVPIDWAPGWVYATFGTNIWIALQNAWHFMPLGVTWSLAVEEQFYLVAPWLLHFSPRRHVGKLIALGCIVPPLLRCLTLRDPDSWGLAAHVLTPFRADSFAAGMLVAWALSMPEGHKIQILLTRRWKPLLAAFGVLSGLMVMSTSARESIGVLVYGYTILSAGFAVIVFATVAIRPRSLLAILETPPLRHLGRHAYFVYLWHPVIHLVLARRLEASLPLGADARSWLVPWILFATTWGLAALSWRLFEGPLVRLGHRFAYAGDVCDPRLITRSRSPVLSASST